MTPSFYPPDPWRVYVPTKSYVDLTVRREKGFNPLTKFMSYYEGRITGTFQQDLYELAVEFSEKNLIGFTYCYERNWFQGENFVDCLMDALEYIRASVSRDDAAL